MFSSSKRAVKSGRKNSSANATASASPSVSFLFSVDELGVNEDLQQGGVIPRTDEYGRWLPPDQQNGFLPPTPGSLYRWDNGVISLVSDCFYENGIWRPSSGATLFVYRKETMFRCNNFIQFLTVEGNASERNMVDCEPPHDRWWPLNFQHENQLSRLIDAGEDSLAGKRCQWTDAFGMETYTSRRATKNASLSGNLAQLIALVAFSCPVGGLSDTLVGDQAWHKCIWRGHPRGDGLVEGRGVITTIYYDPDNTPGSTTASLESLEWYERALIQSH